MIMKVGDEFFCIFSNSNSKDASNSQKLSKGGIPLANGDALLPKPPPWAYPLRTGQDMYHNGYDRMSRSTSEAIDQAMAQLWEAKVKFVRVNFSVEEQLDHAELAAANYGWTKEADCACKPKDDCNSEWVRVVLSAEPGISMDDIVDQDPPRRKEHRRVPSTVAIEEVKVLPSCRVNPLNENIFTKADLYGPSSYLNYLYSLVSIPSPLQRLLL